MFFLERFSKKFDKRFDSVSQATMDLLVDYGWPGNVRELQNIIERAVALSQGPVLALNADLLPRRNLRRKRAGPWGDNGDPLAIARRQQDTKLNCSRRNREAPYPHGPAKDRRLD
jgi:formate hydrogenlyase transcriptional activator